MTNILAFSGKKQSGKTSACNYILGAYLTKLGYVDTITLMNTGQLHISDWNGDIKRAGIFDVKRNTPAMKEILTQYVDPYVKIYSFADLLKRDVCMTILGLTHSQCYGSDEEKNTLTHLKWNNMPGYDGQQNGEYMTARQVMQYIGTEIFRKIDDNIWTNATIRRIHQDAPMLAIIDDCRFPNEVEVVQKANGKVIRFTRNPLENQDQHTSEILLDPDRYDWEKFDAVIDNKNMDLYEQNNIYLYPLLRKWDFIPEIQLD